MAKLKLALYWAASCGGCDVAVLDVNEKILDVAELADIVLWPIALDFKYHHIEAMNDKAIDVCLFNGAVRSSEQERIAKLLRAKSKVMVAFGACACFGGIPSMRNVFSREEVLRRVYIETESTKEGKIPTSPEISPLLEKALPANAVVKVDCFVPGCPPRAEAIKYAITELLQGRIPVLPSEMMRFD